MHPYSSLCDDFGVYVYLNTKMELPTNRETVLHFFEALQKFFPKMTDFERRDSGEYVLEEDRESARSLPLLQAEAARAPDGDVEPQDRTAEQGAGDVERIETAQPRGEERAGPRRARDRDPVAVGKDEAAQHEEEIDRQEGARE